MGPKNFKIVSDPNSTSKHVFIDGKEFSGVRSADIHLCVNEVPRVELEVYAKNVDFDLLDSDITIYNRNINDFPIEICKYWQKDGRCTDLVERLCDFKRQNLFAGHSMCRKYKLEEGEKE